MKDMNLIGRGLKVLPLVEATDYELSYNIKKCNILYRGSPNTSFANNTTDSSFST